MAPLGRTFLGIIGDIVSSGLFFAPFGTFLEMLRSRAVGADYSAIPYCAILVNCATWLIYGVLLKNSTTILIVNGIGIGFEAVYLMAALACATRQIRIHILVCSAVALISVGFMSLFIFLGGHTPEARVRYAGISCVMSGIAMYGSTIPQMVKAYRTRRCESMPLPLIIVGLFNTAIWLAYGVIFKDLYMTIQDACGLFLCGVQIIVYVLISRMPTPPAVGP